MNTPDHLPLRSGERPAKRSQTLLGLQIGLRLVLAACISAALVALGAEGMMVSSAPRWVALTVEPFCFLLLPGAVCAYAEAVLHKMDFSSGTVLRVSLVFYFFFFAVLLLNRLRRRLDREGRGSR